MNEDIIFPKKWKELSEEEQKGWINAYYMPKTRIPEPVLQQTGKVKKGSLELENGAKIRFPIAPVVVSKSNPNIVREFEFWVGKWLITIFHDKTMPHIKYIGISNPSKSKWISQELSYEIICKIYQSISKIAYKYGLFSTKKPKKQRKNRNSSLSLRDNNRGTVSHG